MTLVRRFHPDAELELEAAIEWYEDQQPGLGNDLLEQVEEALDVILAWPRIAPVFSRWEQTPVVRTQAIARFPYQALYYLTARELVLVAFAHNRRKPNYWKDRV